MQSLLKEVAATHPGLHVEMLGINRISDEPYNDLIRQATNGLPWLQDTTAMAVWTRWAIQYRDVVIVDAFNRPVARDNLTTHDLGVSTNYVALRNALLAAAVPADTDHDGLFDEWERGWFESLSATPEGDEDHDGSSNLEEFRFSTNPRDAKSFPIVRLQVVTPGPAPVLDVVFRRFSGEVARLAVESSTDLATWLPVPAESVSQEELRSLHDGVGGAEARFRWTPRPVAASAGFVRVRSLPQAGP